MFRPASPWVRAPAPARWSPAWAGRAIAEQGNRALAEIREESRFLACNPNGKVPLLEITDHGETRALAESNAMLCYLAEGTHLLPDDRWPRAQVLQWLFFEQYSHEPYVATVRWWVHFLHKQDEWKDKIAEAMKKGYAALSVMEQQLAKTPFLAGAAYTVADIALYAYTHVVHEGGYSLARLPAIRAWLSQVERQPGFAPMGAPAG